MNPDAQSPPGANDPTVALPLVVLPDAIEELHRHGRFLGHLLTHQLGQAARIGLVAMGGAGFTALFDYVRVYELATEDGERQ